MRLRREEPAAALARRYDVSENTLYKWREQCLEGGRAALANGKGVSDAGSRRIQELERELGERDRVVGERTIANRILKKPPQQNLWVETDAVRRPKQRFPPDSAVFGHSPPALVLGASLPHTRRVPGFRPR